MKCPAGFCNPAETKVMQSRVRSRQEMINRRFKNWGCMKQVWRNNVSYHGIAFRVIAIVSQLQINTGERLFQVEYNDLQIKNS